MARKHESTAVRQGQIADAARKVIIKYGSEHVTVRRIASEVGISEAAIYRHFKSKKEILSLLADHIEEYLLADLALKAGWGERGCLSALESTLKHHLSATEQRHGVSFQVIAEIISLGDKGLSRKVAGTISKYIGRLKDVLAEGVSAGEVREDVDLEAAATLLFGMMQALVNIWALSNYSFCPEERYARLWNVFRKAVARS
ncbi:MAG: TetR/AcrR family transcriptional regulator [Chloroflexota bacterium]